MDIIRVPEQIGAVLREARLQQDMTQAEVAKKMGISPQAMSRLEKNAGRASFDRIHRLSLLLGLEVLLRPKDSMASRDLPRRSDGNTLSDTSRHPTHKSSRAP